jgi:hypothetical protein
MTNSEYQSMTAVSSHWLIDFLKSPAYCYRQHLGDRMMELLGDALRFGTLVHCLALTPNQLDREIAVLEVNRRTALGRMAWNGALGRGLTPVTPVEMEKARALVANLKKDKTVRRLLFHGKKERTIIQPRARGLLPLKARLDIHHESRRQIVELKTTWSIEAAKAAMERYRYLLSAAFYRDMARGTSTVFVFAETREPFGYELMDMSRAQLEEGREQWQSALRGFDDCWQSGIWPEAETAADDDLTLNFLQASSTANRTRFDCPIGELEL